tara:strand:- start:2518 stop:3156 length:639 start_codon:yes stop_codon:yes gene_type:complete
MKRPRFIAEQARDAKGPLGRLVAFIMARETFTDNKRAIDALEVRPQDRVLDIGCGHGRSLGVLAARASEGHVTGVDPSALMTKIALERNHKLVKAGRIDVSIGGVEKLPFGDCSFDKAVCVHVVYFWKHLEEALREIVRVIKPGGRLALMLRTSADDVSVRTFPAEVYCFRSVIEVIAALEAAGFAVDGNYVQHTEPVLLLATKLNTSSTTS